MLDIFLLRDVYESSKCWLRDKCQRFSNVIRQPTEELTSMMALWPFAQWGLDIMGPFPIAMR